MESIEKLQRQHISMSPNTAVRRPGSASGLARCGFLIDSGYHDTGAERAG